MIGPYAWHLTAQMGRYPEANFKSRLQRVILLDLTSLNLQKTGRSTSQTQQPVSLNSLFPYRELG